MACGFADPLSCPGKIAGDAVKNTLLAGWDALCHAWANAAAYLLEAFARAFAAFPSVDPRSGGIRSVYGLSLGIACTVAAALFLIQVARTAVTHNGEPLAQAVTGLGKAVLSVMVTLSVTTAGVMASNGLTKAIIDWTFGSDIKLRDRLAAMLQFENPLVSATLVFIMAVGGIIAVLLLWFELLLCNAAVAVLISTSPIAAAGQLSSFTEQWWPKLVTATAQLLILKPVIALVFATGFGILGNPDEEHQTLGTMLSGLMILFLAAFAWPLIARFFTFTQVYAGQAGGARLPGLTRARGQNHPGEGSFAGTEDGFSSFAEERTLSGVGTRLPSGFSGAPGPGSAGAATGRAVGGSGAGGGAGPMGVALAAAAGARLLATQVAARMDQMGAHAGLGPPGYRSGHPVVLPPMHAGGPDGPEAAHEADEDDGLWPPYRFSSEATSPPSAPPRPSELGSVSGPFGSDDIAPADTSDDAMGGWAPPDEGDDG